MRIINRFENICQKCKSTIPIDTQVEWTKGSGITHITCPTSEDKFRDITPLTFVEARGLTNCQLCESEANYTDTYYYENYRLCERCWEENLNAT